MSLIVELERAIHHLLNYYLDALLDKDKGARESRITNGVASLREGSEKYPEPVDGGYSNSFGKANT